MSFDSELQRKVDAAVANRDEEALQKLLEDHYEKADAPARPFDAAIRLRPEFRRTIADVALESDAALGWANRISRAKRWVAYINKVGGSFKGMKIVEEGDSWFQYPLLLKDTIDHLSDDDDKAIFSLSGAGDLLQAMAQRHEYREALQQTGARVMLLSGGGNDLLGDGRFENVLLTYQSGMEPKDLLNMHLFDQQVRATMGFYRAILSDVHARFPGVNVLGHAYDLSFPEEDGRWLGGPLKARGIPLELGRQVLGIVLDRFTDELNGLQEDFKDYVFVDLRGKVDRGRQSWFDELHPKGPGYNRAADEFRAALARLVSEGALEAAAGSHAAGQVPATTRAVGGASSLESGIGRVIVLDPGHGGAPPPNKLGGSSWNNAIGPQGTLEKTLTLDVAERTRALLERRGHRVLLTRTTDVNMALRDRAAVARQNGAAVFVSIHFNASNRHDAQGTETFVHPNHTADSTRLCLTVQAAMVAELGHRDRNAEHRDGIKIGEYGVINANSHSDKTACVLHEVSFMDRAAEEARLLSTGYRDRIAGALADGVERYLGTGLEAGVPLAEEEGIGDAIELAALEAGLTVTAFLGLAEAQPGAATFDTSGAGHVGGHMLPMESGTSTSQEAGSRDDFLRQLVASETRKWSGAAAAPAGFGEEDVHEFANVDIGLGLDLDARGDSFESTRAVLAGAFSNLETSRFDMAAFEQFVNGLGLRHFSPAELLFMGSSNAPGTRCANRNSLPPQSLWRNIGATARMLDEIRHRLGAPVRVLSGYRSEAYNRCVGGAAGSRHLMFNAIDWRCEAGSVDQWLRVAKEVRASTPDFRGGIGRYSSFVHVDTRGADTDWNG